MSSMGFTLVQALQTYPNKQRKGESTHQRHNTQYNTAKVTSLGSLFGVPVKLSNGIADKNNNQTYIHKGLLGIQTGC